MRPGGRLGSLAGKGFRPFFLLASLFAAALVPLWLLALSGVAAVDATFDPLTWHAHEMVFGYAVAVIAGFLLTAVGNWTARETLVGGPLLGLAGLWLAGRVAVALGAVLPGGLVAAVDLAFLPVLGLVLARPIIAARSRRNAIVLLVIGALAVTNLLVHLDVLGVLPGWRRRASLLAVDLVLLVIVVVTGRVVPLFTRNATGDTGVRSLPALDGLAAAAMALLVGLDAAAPEHAAAPAVAGAAALLAAARTVTWGARRTLGKPLLWILHLGTLWVPAGLALRAVAPLAPQIGAPLATHALTVGAVGGLTLGMMVRVTLGHTGRPLESGPLAASSFILVTLAAVARALVPLATPLCSYRATLFVAGGLWTAAFILHLVGQAGALTGPRVDGRSG